MRPQGLTLTSIIMVKKMVSVRLNQDLIAGIDSIAEKDFIPNRSLIIECALFYALDNPPEGGFVKYRRKKIHE